MRSTPSSMRRRPASIAAADRTGIDAGRYRLVCPLGGSIFGLPAQRLNVMRTLDEIKTLLNEHLPYLRETYYVDRLGVFGSYVRGEQREDSDVDILITFTKTPSLFEFVEVKLYLEGIFGLRVDLGEPEALKPIIAPQILREVEYV